MDRRARDGVGDGSDAIEVVADCVCSVGVEGSADVIDGSNQRCPHFEESIGGTG